MTGPSVAILTAPGRGAIAVVRVWGPGAVPMADAAFRPLQGRGLDATPPGRLRVGRIGSGLGDEVVAVVVAGEVPEVEIQCHGGPAATALVVDALVAAGATPRSPRAWLEATTAGPVAAAAWDDLARAPTVRVAEVLLDQAQGALAAEVATILEDDIEGAGDALQRLIRRGEVGCRMVDGWKVVLAGRPNVGKSRLLNALVGYERAIVASLSGTTRDAVGMRTALGGWPVELVDTAGLRVADDEVEAAGVARARAEQAAADLVVHVFDGSEPLRDADLAVMAAYPDALRVVNKADLPPAWGPPWPALAVSAERGDGIAGLIAAVAARLVPEAPEPGSGVPFRPEHVEALAAARECLRDGRPAEARAPLGRLLV